MRVLGLQFENYRNLKNGLLEPCPGVNVICGKNAQGKTNLLEALWLFCGGHSFRGSKDCELVAFEKKFALLKSRFYSFNREQKAQIKIIGGKKQVEINGVPKKSSSSLIEKYNAVVFSPEHLTLIKRGPSLRRNFVDSAVCREKLKNAVTISKYSKTLNQRNSLLKEIVKKPRLKETLDIWDESMCFFGAMIIFERLKFLKQLKDFAGTYHQGISEEKETIDFSYCSNAGIEQGDSPEDIKEKLQKALIKYRSDDLNYGCTNVGPHRDDIDILINGKKAKLYASQGQQRSAVLSMKLAEAEILTERTGEKPVILLDDVLSELDDSRQNFLLNKIDGYQVFITCCEKSNKKQLENGRVFKIEEGKIV